MPIGHVKFFDVYKGFGFITPSDGSSDVFVGQNTLTLAGIDVLRQGDKVSFDIRVNPRTCRAAATDLKLVERAKP